MSTNINSTEQIVEINAGDQITNVNIVSQSTTQVISGEQVVTVDVNAGTIPAAWGSITGTLSNQTDLQNALNAKQNNITLTTTGSTGVSTLVGSTLNIPNYVSSTKQTQWDSAYNDKINSAEVSGTTTKTLTLTQQDGGVIQASWSDYDTAPVTSVFGRTGNVVATEGDYNINQLGDVTITSATNGQVLKYNGTAWVNAADASGLTSVGLTVPTGLSVSGSPLTSNGTINVGLQPGYSIPTTAKQAEWDQAYNDKINSANVTGNSTKTLTLTQQDGGTVTTSWTDQGLTSVGLAMPSAFTVSGSPLTTNGTITVTGAGTTSQYVRGDGSLATFPTTSNEAKTLIREVYNSTGATLTKGTVVYINGGQGNLPTVTKAIASGDPTSAQTFGIVQSDITNMNNGFVVIAGGIDNLDTQAYTEGTALYLSPTTAGAFTSTKPYAPNHLVYLGVVVRSHPTQGVIEVKIQNGYELDELHNVSARFPTNKDGLFYNSTSNVWENKSIAGVLGYTPVPQSRIITINGTAQDLSADRTYNVGTVTSVAASGGTGISISGSPVTGSGTISIVNTAPDQTVTITPSGLATVSGTYPNFTVGVSTAYSGSVTSVNASVPTGFEVSGVPITTAGTIDIKFASGYSLPTTAKQTQWDDAYTKRINSLTVTGNSGSSTLVSNVLNVPTYTLSGLGGEPAITAGTSLQYWRGDKTFQTLNTGVVPESGNVYFTEPRVRATVLSGLNITGGSISASDSVLDAFGKVQNQINGLMGGSIFQSTWNASTNNPTLTSSVGTKGYYYIVSVAGSTNLNGITDWQIGDWAIFDGTVWRKVDNTDAVVSVNGFTGTVSLGISNLADVSASSPTDTQLLRFNGTTSKWYNWTPTFEPALTKGNLTEATSSVLTITGGSNAVIGSGTTIQVKQSSATGSGFLSSTDWTTFNNKQNALTNPVTGTGTNNYLSKFTTTGSTIGNSGITDDGTTVTLVSRALSGSTATFSSKLSVNNPVSAYANGITVGGTGTGLMHYSSSTGNVSNIAFINGSNYNYGIIGVVSGNSTVSNDVYSLGYSSTANTSYTSVLTWRSNGIVGINQTNPTLGKLQITGDNDQLAIHTTGSFSSIYFYNGGTNVGALYSSATTTNLQGRGSGGLSLGGSTSNHLSISSTGTIKFDTYTTNGILKVSGGDGTIALAVAGTDYVAPSALSGYLPLTGGTLTGTLTGTTGIFSTKLLVNQTAAISNVTTAVEMTGNGNSSATTQASYQVYANHGVNPTWVGYLQFYKSRGTTQGSVTAVANGDRLGMIRWYGADGTNQIPAAEIYAEVDNTPGTNDMPGRIVFATTADGAASTTERLRIDSSGVSSFTGKISLNSPAGNYANGMTVGGTGTGFMHYSSSTGTQSNIEFYNASTYNYGVIGIVSGDTTINNDIFGLGYVSSPNGSFNTVFNWGSNGNVGVGTSSLGTYKLNVNGTGNFSGALSGTSASFSTSANASSGISIRNTSNGTAANGNLSIGNDLTANGGGISLFSSGFTASGQYRTSGTYFYSNQSGGLTINAEGSSSMYLATNSTLALTISPTQKATFTGQVQSNDSFYVINTPPATNGGLINVRDTVTATNVTSFAGVFFNSSPGNDYSIGKLTENNVGFLQIRNGNNGNELLRINATGAATFSSTVTTGDVLYVGSGGGGGGVWTWNSSDAYIYSPTNKNLWLSSGNTGTNGVKINTSGVLETSKKISVNAPVSPYANGITVGGTGCGYMMYATATGNQSCFQFINGSNYNYGIMGVISGTGAISGDYFGLGYGASGNGSFTPLISWGSNGNVGINQSAPTLGKLQLTGDNNQLAIHTTGTYSSIYFYNGATNTAGFYTNSTTTWLQGRGSGGLRLGGSTSSEDLIIANSGGAATFISSVTATSFFESSDIRLKSNIQDYKSNDILNISAKIYEKDGKVEIGYLAQDIESVLKSAVSIRENGYLDLSYRQVHTAKIAALENKIKELEAKLK